MTLEEKAVAYLTGRPGYTETRKVDLEDMLTLASTARVCELPDDKRAAFDRLLDQLILRGECNGTGQEPVIPGGVDGYAPLADILRDAYDQSARGKGRERHANGKPFLMQPIMSIGRMVGPGYPLGQAMKKAQEAGSMFGRGNTQAAVAELLGVIVYTAAAIALMKEQESKP